MVLFFTLVGLAGCSAGQPKAQDPPASAGQTGTGRQIAGAPSHSGSQPTATTPSTPDHQIESSPGPREVRYHVTPEGLVVRVAGLSLLPAAAPVKMAGGWGIRIEVEARAEDDEAHVVFSPDQGPISVLARINRKGRQEVISDQRQGEGEQFVLPGAPLRFTRQWPASSIRPLAPGDELELEVGLWGIGAGPLSHRPLRKLCLVRMKVLKQMPQVEVLAPENP